MLGWGNDLITPSLPRSRTRGMIVPPTPSLKSKDWGFQPYSILMPSKLWVNSWGIPGISASISMVREQTKEPPPTPFAHWWQWQLRIGRFISLILQLLQNIPRLLRTEVSVSHWAQDPHCNWKSLQSWSVGSRDLLHQFRPDGKVQCPQECIYFPDENTFSPPLCPFLLLLLLFCLLFWIFKELFLFWIMCRCCLYEVCAQDC